MLMPNAGRSALATKRFPVRSERTSSPCGSTFWIDTEGDRFHVPCRNPGSEKPVSQLTSVR